MIALVSPFATVEWCMRTVEWRNQLREATDGVIVQQRTTGAAVGTTDGTAVGCIVGAIDGSSVDGAAVGSAVGGAVGGRVGGILHREWTHCAALSQQVY